MAEYIKFRLTAAKAGVTMAFVALLGGIAEAKPWGGRPARARQSSVVSHKWSPVLSLGGITGNLRTSLVQVEKDLSSLYQKDHKALTGAIGGVYHKVTDNFYDKHAANAKFIPITTADAQFLNKADTAANSAELGGKTADAFIQGNGAVATGGETASLNGGLIGLLHSADGTLTVSVGITGNGPEVKIENNSASAIDWISSLPVGPAGNTTNNGTIPGDGFVQLGLGGAIGQVTFQFLPAVQSQAFTLVLSTEPASAAQGTQRFVGQMINGGG
jgi:hypothetical protein